MELELSTELFELESKIEILEKPEMFLREQSEKIDSIRETLRELSSALERYPLSVRKIDAKLLELRRERIAKKFVFPYWYTINSLTQNTDELRTLETVEEYITRDLESNQRTDAFVSQNQSNIPAYESYDESRLV